MAAFHLIIYGRFCVITVDLPTIPTLRNVMRKANNHRTRQSCMGEINTNHGSGGYHVPLSPSAVWVAKSSVDVAGSYFASTASSDNTLPRYNVNTFLNSATTRIFPLGSASP